MKKDTPRVRIGEVRTRFGQLDGPTLQTRERFTEVITRFESFVSKAYGVDCIADVTPTIVEAFVRAKGSTGNPATATMHVRRCNLRTLFRIARREFGFEGDPTLDVMLPPRSMLTTRPLTNDEIVLGRSFSHHTFNATRQPVAWALGEATAITAELPYITTDDLDLDCTDGPRVWLHGSRKRNERWGFLDDWGALQLERRAAALEGTTCLLYKGTGSEFSRQASCCNVLRETFIRAGLDSEPDIRPNSLAAWAGVMALEEMGSIEGVARRLGMSSLDAAAAFINHDWR